MSRIEGTNSALTNLRNAPKVNSGGPTQEGSPNKSIGETPPTILPLDKAGPIIQGLFSQGGPISKLLRKLNHLKKDKLKKKLRATPALGTIACVDDDGLIYLGKEFLEKYHDQEDVLAGVMGHETGHACAVKPKQEDLNEMNWNELFAERKSHEVLADEISGRLLAMMDYPLENFLHFLTETTKGTHNLKYHDSQVRAQIVKNGYQAEKRKKDFAKDLFPGDSNFKNHYQYKLIDTDV